METVICSVVDNAEALVADFRNLMNRIALHTSLCESLHTLRKTAETDPQKTFFRAVIDIHDCARATRPEDMTKNMAEAILNAVRKLSIPMAQEQLFSMIEDLFDTGLRPWPCAKDNNKE